MKNAPIKLKDILFEALMGKKLTLDTGDDYYPALLSKNVDPKTNKKYPYRFSYFYTTEDGLEPMGHELMSIQELNFLLKKKKLPPKIEYELESIYGQVQILFKPIEQLVKR